MSALSARRWRVRGQMVATGDSARRCARVDGVYSTPGVDGVYSTTTLVDGARRAAIVPLPAVKACSWSAAVRSRRRFGVDAQPCVAQGLSQNKALWV